MLQKEVTKKRHTDAFRLSPMRPILASLIVAGVVIALLCWRDNFRLQGLAVSTFDNGVAKMNQENSLELTERVFHCECAVAPAEVRWQDLTHTQIDVTICNVSGQPVDIKYRSNILEHLTAIARDEHGKELTRLSYAGNYSPIGGVQTMRLAPSELFIHPLRIDDRLIKSALRPGRYYIELSLSFELLKCRSGRLTLIVE